MIWDRFFKPRDKPRRSPKNEDNADGEYLTLASKEGWILQGGTAAGKYVSNMTAMQTAAVYACVKLLAEAVASLPLHVYRKDKDGSKIHIDTHPLYKLLHDAANPEISSFIWRETSMTHLLLWGNAYSQIIRNGLGQVIALYPLLPDKMTVCREEGKLVYKYMSDGKGAVKLKREDVLHIAGLGFDGLVGYSPITMQRNTIGLSMAAEEYGAKFFANGARPGGVLEHPGVVKDSEKLKESWNSQYQGSENFGKIGILEEGMKYNPISIPPEDAQFLETRKYQKADIASIFRVPPHMIGDLDKSSFNNIEQMSLDFVKYTLNPHIARWEQALKKSLVKESEKDSIFIMFNLEGLLRGDYKSRIDAYARGIQNGFYCVNDVRKLEDMPLLDDAEGGNLHFVNGNMVKLKDVGAAYAEKIKKKEGE